MVSDIASMVQFAIAPAGMCGWTDNDMYLSQCPLYFSGPISNCSQMLHLGATAILMDNWTPEGCLALIEKHKVTASMMVPTMFHRLLALPDEVKARYDVSSLRHNAILQSAGMCPVDVKRAMIEWWGPVFYESYGGTEGRYTCISSDEWLEHPGSVGRPYDGITLKVLDDDGNECPPGQIGTVYGKLAGADGLGTVYFNAPEKTTASRKGEFFTLGDMGYLDEDGWLYLADRRFDLIVSGGANIYPAEIEPVLLHHPKVVDAAVIGIPNAEWGQEVKAIVQPVSMDEAGPELEADIIAFAQRKLAKYKCPRSVDFREELPRLPSGKLYKRFLRDEYEQRAAQGAAGAE
jgi:long-chain acyl-CoA synthetase